jgi:hypothetical protein
MNYEYVRFLIVGWVFYLGSVQHHPTDRHSTFLFHSEFLDLADGV